MYNIRVIKCLPEKSNFVVCYKEVRADYIPKENEYIVDIDFDPSIFQKNYDPVTQTFSVNLEVKNEMALLWRNSELERTDSLMQLTDYPYKENMATYRQALRDWPSTVDFPDTRPTAL